MTAEGIYECYVAGSEAQGRMKYSYHSEMCRVISETEKCTERNIKDISAKIASIQKSFRDLSYWLRSTCSILSVPVDIRGYIINKWPHYFKIEPIMTGRPNTFPLFTN